MILHFQKRSYISLIPENRKTKDPIDFKIADSYKSTNKLKKNYTKNLVFHRDRSWNPLGKGYWTRTEIVQTVAFSTINRVSVSTF